MRALGEIRRLAAGHSPLVYPVSRRLCACTLAYLAGALCASFGSLPLPFAGILCALFLATVLWCRRTGRRALLPVCMAFFLVGNGVAGAQLGLSDAPTAANTPISGTVVGIEGDNRVRLSGVLLPDGKATNRPVIVTLMAEADAPPVRMPKVGQRVSGAGRLFAQDGVRNPGGVDQRLRALCDGYELSGYLLPGWTAEGEPRFALIEAFRQLRVRLAARLTELLGEDAGLFMALMLGEKADVDAQLAGAMRLTGTAHILSVSGMHLTMISAALAALLHRLPIGRRAAHAVQAVALLLFAGLTGFAVGTVRALIMQYVALLARIRGRKYDPLTAIALSALLITLVSPLMVFHVGFQYSFFVVLGIHLLTKTMESLPPMRWLHQKARWLAEMIVISLSAQIAALPMQLSLYGYVPLLALPMNLLCGVFMPFLMIGGWALLALGLALPGVAVRAAAAVTLPARLFEAASLFAADLKGGILRLPAPARPMLLLFGAAMALVSRRIRFGRRRYRAFACALALMGLLYLPRLNPAPRYVQLDVGQGDASLIRAGRHAVVIDVGPAQSYDLLRYLRSEGLHVDALVLSHLDEDHAGALEILCSSEVGVNRVVMAHRAQEDVASEAVLEGLAQLEAMGIQTEFVKEGDAFEAMGLRFNVLSPTDDLSGSNERSLLLRVDAAGTELLLCGDLTREAEPNAVPDCDVLKVAHHGSRNASSTAFLEKASPEVAVISCGAGNSYGHPHSRVLGDLETVGAAIHRTDEAGCVTVWLGEELRIETFL